MKLLRVVGNQVTYEPDIMSFNAFKTIWDRDKTKDKSIATKELTFVHWMVYWDSPYNKFEETERKTKLLKDLGLKSVDSVLQEALDLYAEWCDTRLMRSYKLACFQVSEAQSFLNQTGLLNQVNSKGDNRFKPLDLVKASSELLRLEVVINEITDKLRAEESLNDNKSKGGYKTKIFEDKIDIDGINDEDENNYD